MVKKYKIGFIGNIVEPAEYIFHNPNFELINIIAESERVTGELVNFSVVRNVPLEIIKSGSSKSIFEVLFCDKNIDFYIMCSFGIIIPDTIVNKFEIYNIHFSFLPDYKGRNPGYWCTINNEINSGISLHIVENGVDSGRIISRKKVSYFIWMDEKDLYNKQLSLIPELLNDLILYKFKKIDEIDNNNNNNYYRKVKKDDFSLDINKDSPGVIYNKIRSQARYNGALICSFDNKKIMIKKAIFCFSKEKNLKPGTIYIDEIGINYIFFNNEFSLKLLQYDII